MEIINENFDCEVETEIWLLLWQMFPKLINGDRGVFVVRNSGTCLLSQERK